MENIREDYFIKFGLTRPLHELVREKHFLKKKANDLVKILNLQRGIVDRFFGIDYCSETIHKGLRPCITVYNYIFPIVEMECNLNESKMVYSIFNGATNKERKTVEILLKDLNI